MFYSTDILSRRKEGLGLVWLAATLGDRSVVRRLTRRDFLSVDVSRVCVVEPAEPMALRFSSQLMFGIVRIYMHQSEIWMAEVTQVYATLRKSIALISQPRDKEADNVALNMRILRANVDAITLPADMTFYALDFDPTFLIDLVDPFALRAATPTGIADGFTPTTPPRPPRYVVPEERITLPVPVYEEEPGIARVGVPRRRVEEGIVLPPEEEEEGFDLGLDIGGVEPEEFPEEAMPLAEPSSEAPEAFPPGLLRPIEGAPPIVPVPPSAEVTPLPIPLALPAPVPPELAAAPRPRPRKVRILEDRTLELTDEELRNSRRNYEEIMEAQRLAVHLRERQRLETRAAHNLIFEPPVEIIATPGLFDVWSSTIGASLRAVDDRFRAARRRAIAASPPRPLPLEEEVPPPSPGIELGIEGIPSDITTYEEEVARGFTPTEWARRAAELPPWQVLAERRREESISGIRPVGIETLSDIATRSFGVDTPTGLRRVTPTRRAPSISFPSPYAPSIEGFDLGPPPPPSPSSFRLPPPPAPPTVEEFPHPASIFQQDLETETSNFLSYAQTIRDELEDTFLFFSDLAPVASSSPSVAAQAFYHVLALTQAGRMKAKQDEAYAEIEITLV